MTFHHFVHARFSAWLPSGKAWLILTPMQFIFRHPGGGPGIARCWPPPDYHSAPPGWTASRHFVPRSTGARHFAATSRPSPPLGTRWDHRHSALVFSSSIYYPYPGPRGRRSLSCCQTLSQRRPWASPPNALES